MPKHKMHESFASRHINPVSVQQHKDHWPALFYIIISPASWGKTNGKQAYTSW